MNKNIKILLANYLGVENEDISSDDFFDEDLHMGASEMSDFMNILENEGIDTSKINLEIVETISDLEDQIV